MTLNTSLRNWHSWIGVLIALPVMIVSITAIIMAHGQDLGIRNIPHNLGWLPGYQDTNDSKMKASNLDIRSTLTTRDGRYFIGTRYGLYELQQNQLLPVEDLPAADIRSIKESSEGVILLASRNGVWQYRDSHWKKIYKSDAWDIELRPNNTIRISTRAKGFLESPDGGAHWKSVRTINELPAALSEKAQAEEMNWGKLIFDLHTGRAFFGKDLDWLWIDAIGFTLTLLVLSGLFLWRSINRQKTLLQVD